MCRCVQIERTPWGDLEEESDESSEEEDDEAEEQMDDDTSESGISSVTSIASMSSLASGLETPDAIDLRKDTGPNKALYQVLEQKEVKVGGAMMGSSHGYVMDGAQAGNMAKGTGEALLKAGQTELNVALDPKDLESDEVRLPCASTSSAAVWCDCPIFICCAGHCPGYASGAEEKIRGARRGGSGEACT